MWHRNRMDEERRWSRHERQYLLVKIAAILMLPIVLASLLALLPKGYAAVDNGNVDGANGVLHVRGALTESACRLDMASAWQTVNLGEIGTGRLQQVGDRGAPVKVQLRLQDCLRSPANNRDTRTGNLLWAPTQPAVSVSFIAPADLNSPELAAVRGAQGLGLRLLDDQGRDVRLGERGAPLFLAAGQNQLNYSVMPERTRLPLQAGAYSALINIRFNYD
ncbi:MULTISPECIES: fimbrial protein [Serratia]|uniref:PAP fimbrial minor pilin protein n=1 Tax=Serratia quinivorans TaxID=137545 RepID=A0A379ZXQ9_9GAMM|nr:PAP fimbrial minor pilin protein precursor [Serratia quinivorans]SUI70110.1 PAP fimbrial minor pilin protein precursor [Serratia quinivorans]